MKKFELEIQWYASMRGYDTVTVEAESEEEARANYWEKLDIDYNDHTKIINSDREVMGIEEIK